MALPTAHILLDMTESLIIESMVSDDPKEDQRQRDKFLAQLYRSETKVRDDGKPDGWIEPPPGFDDDDENEAAFDTVMAMTR